MPLWGTPWRLFEDYSTIRAQALCRLIALALGSEGLEARSLGFSVLELGFRVPSVLGKV